MSNVYKFGDIFSSVRVCDPDRGMDYFSHGCYWGDEKVVEMSLTMSLASGRCVKIGENIEVWVERHPKSSSEFRIHIDAPRHIPIERMSKEYRPKSLLRREFLRKSGE